MFYGAAAGRLAKPGRPFCSRALKPGASPRRPEKINVQKYNSYGKIKTDRTGNRRFNNGGAFMENCMCAYKRFVNWGMERWKQFNVADVAVFKTCLLSIGALIGIYCSKKLKKLAPLLWIVAIGSYVYIFYRMIVQQKDG